MDPGPVRMETKGRRDKNIECWGREREKGGRDVKS